MFLRKLALWLVLVGTVLAFISPTITSAQSSETVTATATVNHLNVRYAPSQWNRYGFDNRVGQLNMGDEVIVQKMETVEVWSSRDFPWVYVVQPSTGLEGWVASDYLDFARDDWQDILPKVESIDELSYLEGAAQIPLRGQLYGGVYTFIRVRAEPYYGAPILAELREDQEVDILGSAVINGNVHYVYVRQLPANGTLEGWVWHGGILTTVFSPNDNWRYALPVLYEHNLSAEYAGLPQALLNENFRYMWVRTEPSRRSTRVSYVNQGEVVVVHGRTGEWFYITFLNSYFNIVRSGWVYAPNFTLLHGVSFESLPVIEA